MSCMPRKDEARAASRALWQARLQTDALKCTAFIILSLQKDL